MLGKVRTCMDLLLSNSGQAGVKAVRTVYDGVFSHYNRFSSYWRSKIVNRVPQKYGS